jgi:long-subunit fatty acid transport protein
MRWSAFEELPIIFPENPEFSAVTEENFDDAAQWRVGMEWRAGQRWAVQAGYLEDETGQPVESMSPLLGDADRTSYSFGFSYYTKKFRLDLGYEHVMSDPRSTEGRSWDGYDGTYDNDAQLAGATVTFKF